MSEAAARNGLDLEDAARRAVEAAIDAGADEADAWCEDATNRTVRVYDAAVESVTEAGSKGAGVRVVLGRPAGHAHGSGPRPGGGRPPGPGARRRRGGKRREQQEGARGAVS